MSAAKQQLVAQVRGARDFCAWSASHGRNLQEAGVAEGATPNEFLKQFGTLYSSQPTFRNGLLMGLVRAVMARIGGVVNAKVDEDVLALCQVFYFVSPKGYTLFRQNLFGVSERHLRRLEKAARGSSIIDESSVQERVDLWSQEMAKGSGKKILGSIALDGTRVPKSEQTSTAFGVTVGGVYPNHMLSVDMERRPVPEKDLACEVKCFLLSTQHVAAGMSPLKMIAARPQSSNEQTVEYNEMVVKCAKKSPHMHLVSVAADGLSAESKFIKDGLLDFMLGVDNCVYIVDPNHVAKALRSQVVFGSSIITMGNGLVDPGLLMAAGIKKDLYQVSDFASDGIVLQLCSGATMGKLQALLPYEDVISVLVTALTLFFIRIFLVGVNTKLLIVDRPCLLWSALIWLTSLRGLNVTTKRNVATSIIGCVFLCLQRGIRAPRLCTTEPLEHTFGNLRQRRREFTVKELIEHMSRLETSFKNMTLHDIKVGGGGEGVYGWVPGVQRPDCAYGGRPQRPQ
eukprot:GHVU01221756.1.p1 GENE.GHVU01221756.1~~GHVU01221756.1.p1  ORF type:complete len:529 (+),score=56.22 GHVU01221756.1:54-1589(+)